MDSVKLTVPQAIVCNLQKSADHGPWKAVMADRGITGKVHDSRDNSSKILSETS